MVFLLGKNIRVTLIALNRFFVKFRQRGGTRALWLGSWHITFYGTLYGAIILAVHRTGESVDCSAPRTTAPTYVGAVIATKNMNTKEMFIQLLCLFR